MGGVFPEPVIFWLVLSDEQMSKGWPFFLLNDEQMSNWLGVEHQPVLFLHLNRSGSMSGIVIINPRGGTISLYIQLYVYTVYKYTST